MQQNDVQYQKMIKTPIPRLVISLAVPTMASMLVTSVYNVADAYFVSKLGRSASGAVGIVFSLMAVIQAVGFMVGMGAGSVISRLLGKKENAKAQKTASCALLTSIVFGIGLSIPGLVWIEPLMLWMGATDTILPYAAGYAKYILYVAPVMSASFVLNNLLRAEGKTKLSMVGIACGSLLNVGLDPLFIFGFGWGIRGAALATAISQCVGFVVLSAFFWGRKTLIRLSVKELSWDLSIYKAFLGNGMPSLFRQGLASVASVTLNHVAAGYGDAAVAAMSVVGKIFMVVFCVLIGLGQGYQPVAGYNYGAKEYGRVRQAYRFMMRVGNIGMILLGAGLYFCAGGLVGQFVPDDGEVAAIGTAALRMQCAAMPFLTLGIACNMTFQAVGKSVWATVFASLRQGLFFLPAIVLLPRTLGVTGMEAAQPVADVGTFLVCWAAMRQFMKGLKEKTGTSGRQ